MENRKTFTYNGVNSADYGLYISGDSVYNAPSRVYEMVDIAGRNGQLAIDQGRFENIEVTYPAFIFAETQTEFAQRLRDIRAWLMSPVGYQRLEDTYHPDEFRMAIYMSGLEADPTHYNEAGEFELTFNCKPQRFLKSGEEEITIGEWGETQTVSGSVATFEAESNTGIKSLVVDIEPVQSGSGDPSPTNVRPISGWDSVVAEQSGKNIIDTNSFVDGVIGNNGALVTGGATIGLKGNGDLTFTTTTTWKGVTSGFIRVESGQSYALSLNGAVSYFFWCWYDENYSFISKAATVVTNNKGTAPNNAKFLRLTFQEATADTFVITGIQLEKSSASTDYESFGHSYSISLGRTVYGGTLDVVSGKLTINRASKKVSDMSWSYIAPNANWTKGVFYAGPVVGKANGIDNIWCERYKTLRNGTDDYLIFGNAPNTFIYIVDSTYSTVSEMVSAIGDMSFIYELATPTEIQLTPEQIETILGVNNIWADSGEVSVEYGDDPNILVNPTPFESLPLIEVVGVGSLTVGNITVTITGEETQDIFIDSDIMEAYEDDNGAIISRNDRISLSGMNFPTLGTDTGITYTGLTSVTVTPRWWTI